MKYWNDKAPITTTYRLREQDVKKLESEARRWKRAALRSARLWEGRSLDIDPLDKISAKIRKMNGGKL